MKRWVPWAIGGGAVVGVGLYLSKTPTTPEAAVSPTEIDRLMADAYADGAFSRLIDDLVKTGGGATEAVKRTYAGPLELQIEIRASGFEKFFAGDITPDVKKTAAKIAAQLATVCPGAPKLAVLKPSLVKLSDTSRGFRARIVWPAIWSSETTGPVRPQVAECIEQLIRTASKKIGARLLSLQASRLDS
jgi:hypothetical protein